MNVSYLEHHLKQLDKLPKTIVDEMDIYTFVKDVRACNSINKALGTTFKAVYRNKQKAERNQMKASNLCFDTGDVFVVKADNTVLKFRNSEWFSIRPVESHKWEK